MLNCICQLTVFSGVDPTDCRRAGAVGVGHAEGVRAALSERRGRDKVSCGSWGKGSDNSRVFDPLGNYVWQCGGAGDHERVEIQSQLQNFIQPQLSKGLYCRATVAVQ